VAVVSANGRWPTPPTEEQQFFLERLGRLIALRVTSTVAFDATMLLHVAIYSTYADCLELGVGERAREIIVRARPVAEP
jgi:hypothetical protein